MHVRQFYFLKVKMELRSTHPGTLERIQLDCQCETAEKLNERRRLIYEQDKRLNDCLYASFN